MPHSITRILIRFLGSMNLAVTLLVAIAIASIIGTVVQQNQPYPDYVLKFGPFWFEFFNMLDLFSVYSSIWFLSILGFLVLSTSVCIYRNIPVIFNDIRSFRIHVQYNALEKLPTQFSLDLSDEFEDVLLRVEKVLSFHKYRFRKQSAVAGSIVVAAKKGDGGRLGYVFSHVAIVVICIGGLIDGNLPMKFREWSGKIAVETRRIPSEQIPDISTLGEDNLSFRANVDIAEGGRSSIAFIDYKDGYLLQKLPFAVEVSDFRIEHYASGQPKSFESDLILHNLSNHQVVKKTISVNHPLAYEGYSIYQSSFGDGGSILDFKVWSLSEKQSNRQLSVAVKNQSVIDDLNFELSEFRPFNVVPDPSGEKKFINLGPSFQYKLRAASGSAREFLTYMQPNLQQGRWFFVTGVRGKLSEPFNYWFIPADNNKEVTRFMHFLQLLHNPQKLRKLAETSFDASSHQVDRREKLTLVDFMLTLTNHFLEGGYPRITDEIEKNVPKADQGKVAELSATILQQLLKNVYLDVLHEEGVRTDQNLSDFDLQFFGDAVEAANLAGVYGAPWYFELEHFKHIEATGLQITKSPGEWLVFPGCLLLVLGVFCMFYLPQRRLWIIVSESASGTHLFVAGHTQRNRYDFEKEILKIQTLLEV